MKSIIKSIRKTEKQLYATFKLDDKILGSIGKAFREIKPSFNLSKYRKYKGEKWLDDFYELSNEKEGFSFIITIKKNALRLKLIANPDLTNKFMKVLMKYIEWAKPKKK